MCHSHVRHGSCRLVILVMAWCTQWLIYLTWLMPECAQAVGYEIKSASECACPYWLVWRHTSKLSWFNVCGICMISSISLSDSWSSFTTVLMVTSQTNMSHGTWLPMPRSSRHGMPSIEKSNIWVYPCSPNSTIRREAGSKKTIKKMCIYMIMIAFIDWFWDFPYYLRCSWRR